MRKFYERAVIQSIAVMLGAIAVIVSGHHLAYFSKALLPSDQAFIPWRLTAVSGSGGEVRDRAEDAESYLAITDSVDRLAFAFRLSSRESYPFISVEMHFNRPRPEAFVDFVDLSEFQRIRFTAKCSRAEILAVVLRMFDPQVPDEKGRDADRLALYFYDCPKEAAMIDAPFAHFEVPEWWLVANQLALTDNLIAPRQVVSFAWGASSQTSLDTHVEVQLSDVELIGYRWQVLALSLALTLLGTIGFIIYLFKAHSRALRMHLGAKFESDKPLVAYQKVVLETHRDKERSAIIGFIAEHYTHSELTLEYTTQKVGVSRTKVNEIIKDEIGLTFTAYINKLRLNEAARLLKESPEASVSEVAFAVGYNNPSYFNKLFKAEFGCTPKAYRAH